MEGTKRKAPGTIQRTSGIGGSDVAILCGLSKYKTAYQLYLEKRGELLPDDADSEIMRFGRRFEKPVADEFAFRTGRKTWRQRKTLRHPQYKFLLGNIDRWQERDGEKGILEVKCTDWRLRKGWLEGGVPDGHYLQIQHYLMVAGCSFGSFGVLFGGNELHVFDVDRDENTIQQLLALELDFWHRVQQGNPPDYSFGEAGAALAKRIYAKSDLTKKPLILEGAEAEGKLRRLLQVKQAIKQREIVEKDLETWCKLQLQDAEKAIFPNLATITWKQSNRNHVDLETIRKELPGLLEAYTTEEPSRRFSIKPFDKVEIEEEEEQDDAIVITTGVRAIELPD